jgi:Rad3-related DNA helicase
MDEDGCPGHDGGCVAEDWAAGQHWCRYREQKERAMAANIVVTNADMLIVNDRLLPEPFFDREGPLLVDEAHTLEAKLRDFSDRSLRADWLTRESPSGAELGKFIGRFKREPETVTGAAELPGLLEAFMRGIEAQSAAGITPGKRALEMYESAGKIYNRVVTPHDNALVWADGEALKLSWVDVSASARELLEARPFGLVSATIPGSMASSLGLKDARIVDVGHPFDYKKQATLSISQVNGAYQYAREKSNLQKRAVELKEHILKHDGGALCLFSSFKDMENVYEEIIRDLRGAGLTVLKQGGMKTNQELGEEFKRHGNAVLFGSESFATGFDVPGNALRFVSIWKLPYPGKDPVTEALMKRFYLRYNDLMLTRVTQAIGRLIRTVDDEGHVWIGDSRAEGKVLGDSGLMTRHLKEFARA